RLVVLVVGVSLVVPMDARYPVSAPWSGVCGRLMAGRSRRERVVHGSCRFMGREVCVPGNPATSGCCHSLWRKPRKRTSETSEARKGATCGFSVGPLARAWDARARWRERARLRAGVSAAAVSELDALLLPVMDLLGRFSWLARGKAEGVREDTPLMTL